MSVVTDVPAWGGFGYDLIGGFPETLIVWGLCEDESGEESGEG